MDYRIYYASETRALAAQLFRQWQLGQVIALVGELGSGKTTFAQGLAEALWVEGVVWSPTLPVRCPFGL